MSWNSCAHQQRLKFVLLALGSHGNFRALCRQFSISAPTGYKWLARYRVGGENALHELSRKPRRSPQRLRSAWRKELLTLRRKHPGWGVKKLRIILGRTHPRTRQLPSLRTLGRWLKSADLTIPRPPRHRPGPQVDPPLLTQPRQANEVWTIDFKGWFRTADGQRCDPLTIRDLFTRHLLSITIVPQQSDAWVRKIMTAVFKKYGLPRIIRTDNGSPFAGVGPLNLSTLSVWWLRLGIKVEFTRRGRPQDNGAHEQMHRILKTETASPAAANLRAQQRRLDRWRHQYNTQRPHEALAGRSPADLYHRSPRPFHSAIHPSYPETWLSRCVRPNGWIKFEGQLRFIGRSFARQIIGLQPLDADSWNVHLDHLLIGTLHRRDGAASMRAATFKNPHIPRKPTQPISPLHPGVNHVVAIKCKPCRGHEV